MHLLPPNSTAQERALSLATARALSVPMPVKNLWSPWDCPADVLPWLAWSLSVEPWRPDWTEQTKRAAIAAAIETHRIKGTIGAVRRALATLGYDVEIDETGAIYTFQILVNAENGLTEQDYATVEAAALVAKNARSHLRSVAGIIRKVSLVVLRAVGIDGQSTNIGAAFVRELKSSALFSVLSACTDVEITIFGEIPEDGLTFSFSGAAVGPGVHFNTIE